MTTKDLVDSAIKLATLAGLNARHFSPKATVSMLGIPSAFAWPVATTLLGTVAIGATSVVAVVAINKVCGVMKDKNATDQYRAETARMQMKIC